MGVGRDFEELEPWRAFRLPGAVVDILLAHEVITQGRRHMQAGNTRHHLFYDRQTGPASRCRPFTRLPSEPVTRERPGMRKTKEERCRWSERGSGGGPGLGLRLGVSDAGAPLVSKVRTPHLAQVRRESAQAATRWFA